MRDNVIIGQYMETDSVLHRLDPRTKLLSLVVVMIGLLMLKPGIGYAVAAVFALGVLTLSKVSFRAYWKGLKPVLFVLMFTFLYHALFTKGTTVIWTWSYIGLTAEGLAKGAAFVGRIVLLILMASVLTFTTKPLELALGFQKLLAPLSRLHVPVEQISLMIVIAIRFIPTILQELDRILLAQKARGVDMAALKLPQRIFAYVPILVPLLFTTIGRAEQLAYAIEARAYGNGKGRTSYRQLKFGPLDAWTGGTAVLFAVAILAINMGGIS
ncbi:energy-coupling factor transporter transmembrane component T [Paenibacillus sp. VCA1]|uniref:energy-coupling factor transporter transmembrane component T family protein n=1 Tax=Paenibacillus sp. VCA1 TaxID=3039148 RepID=UPI002870DD1B|nr:energy-coupling factor transporter transmembrane component T [Paenibacillus sp. VCA1]MDR9853994.1 energy-coupling factor transporter transmembrane component T [Paenibacillus sp. VCA1]